MGNSNHTYNKVYAKYYDVLNSHKDYVEEALTLSELIKSSNAESKLKVLDVGCGTGLHAIALAKLSKHQIFGIDISPHVIAEANSKSSDVVFDCIPIQYHLEKNYNFVYSLFNVINCLSNLDELTNFFKSIFDRLCNDGHFFFEAWNQIAVTEIRPKKVIREYKHNSQKIIRTVIPDLSQILFQKLKLNYIIDIKEKSKKINLFEVTHDITLFTPMEISHCLNEAGFDKPTFWTALPTLNSASSSDRMLSVFVKKNNS